MTVMTTTIPAVPIQPTNQTNNHAQDTGGGRSHPSTMASTYLKFQPSDRIVLNLASNDTARTVITVENTSA